MPSARQKAREKKARAKRRLRSSWHRQRARLKLRHGDCYYLFLCCIMALGPVVLLAGVAGVGQAAWLTLTIGRDVAAYTSAVGLWGQLERERFSHAAPGVSLNSTLPGAVAGMRSVEIESVQPLPSRLEGGEPYLPLRYRLAPSVAYQSLRYHSHAAPPSLGLAVWASAGPGRAGDGSIARGQQAWVGSVPPLPLIRERREHSTSLHCTTSKGVYDFRHNVCTKFEVLRRLCLVMRPGSSASGWSLADNPGAVGCELPVAPAPIAGAAVPRAAPSELDIDDDDENPDAGVRAGQSGWGLGLFGWGSRTSGGRPELAASLYEQVYLGEFLEEVLTGEVAVVLLSAADPAFVASTLPSLRDPGSVMPAPWMPLRLGFPLIAVGVAMSVPWCVCAGREREARREERRGGGAAVPAGSEGDEMDDLFADLESGERAPLLGLGGQESRHRRWAPPLQRPDQQPSGGGPGRFAATAAELSAAQRAAAPSDFGVGSPAAGVTTSGPSSMAGRLESTHTPIVDVNGPDFMCLASELGVDLAAEGFLHQTLLQTLASPLPEPWTSHPVTPDIQAPPGVGSVYYYNADAQQSSYIHPLRQQTAFAVQRLRQEHNRSSGAVAGMGGGGAPSTSRPPPVPQPAAPQPPPAGAKMETIEEAEETPEKKEQLAAWEARRQQLAQAAESPELGYADPWAAKAADGDGAGGRQGKDTPSREGGGGGGGAESGAGSGYIDTWALQNEPEVPPAPAPAPKLLTPPNAKKLEEMLAQTSPQTPPQAPPGGGRPAGPPAGMLTPPSTRELERKLEQLASRDARLASPGLALDVGAGSAADEAPPTTDELSQSLAEMATRSPRGRLAEALRSSPMQPGGGTQERTGPEP